MEIRVSGKHLEVTDAIREYAEGKAAKLPRYYDRVAAVDVIADKHDWNHEVEIIVHIDGADPFIGKSSGSDLYACIDEAVDKLERQLTDHKTRLRNPKHRAG